MHKNIVIIIFVFILSSCSSGGGCMLDLNMSMKATIYKMTYDASVEQFVPEIYSLPVSLYGIGRDSLLYDMSDISKMEIPLKKHDSISSFVLTTYYTENDSSISILDTIDFYHRNEEEFISLDCGCIVKNNISGIGKTTNRIDSIIVENPLVNLTSGNNIKIYLKEK